VHPEQIIVPVALLTKAATEPADNVELVTVKTPPALLNTPVPLVVVPVMVDVVIVTVPDALL
jgi:hypothetical protein